MTLLSLSPEWFYGYDVALEAAFAIVAMIIAIFALRMYRTTGQKQVRLLGIAFALISTSYIIQSVLNLLIVTKKDQQVCAALNLSSSALIGTYGIYAHVLFMTAGLCVLAYMTLRIDRVRTLALLLTIALIGIFSSVSPLHTFFLISTILLAIILWHFISSYLRTRQNITLLVVLAFGFLLFGSLHFMLAVNHATYYALGHVLELIAYGLILANLYLVVRHGKKA